MSNIFGKSFATSNNVSEIWNKQDFVKHLPLASVDAVFYAMRKRSNAIQFVREIGPFTLDAKLLHLHLL